MRDLVSEAREGEIRGAVHAWARERVPEERLGWDRPRLKDELYTTGAGSRIDVAVVTTDELWGVEIKSAGDKLSRLKRQAEQYALLYDRVWLAAPPEHAQKGFEKGHAPPWWGVLALEQREGILSVRETRPAKLNPEDRPAFWSLRLLHKPELIDVLSMLEGGRPKGITRRNKANVIKRLLDQLSPAQARAVTRRVLLQRDPWHGALTL